MVSYADREVGEIMGRRYFYRTRSFFGIGMGSRDDAYASSNKRQDRRADHEICIACIFGVDGDRNVAEHRFRSRGSNHDKALGRIGNRVANIPEMAFNLSVLYFKIG